MNEPQSTQDPSAHNQSTSRSILTIIAAIALMLLLAGLLILSVTGFNPWQSAEPMPEDSGVADNSEQPSDEQSAVDTITQTIAFTESLAAIPVVTPTLSISIAKVEDDYSLGLQSMNAGDYEQAIEYFTLATGVEEQSAWAYLGRAFAYERLGQPEAAIEDYTTALEVSPPDAKIYHSRGNVYTTSGQYDLAIEDYEQALALEPTDAKSYHNRGWVYNMLGDYVSALADYTLAIQFDHDPLARAYNNRGLVNANLGNYEQAIEDYTQAIELDPDYSEAINLNPTYAKAYYNRGRAYAAQEEYEAAITEYDAALGIDPSYARAYNQRGDVYQELGNEDAAMADFQKAVSLGSPEALQKIIGK